MATTIKIFEWMGGYQWEILDENAEPMEAGWAATFQNAKNKADEAYTKLRRGKS